MQNSDNKTPQAPDAERALLGLMLLGDGAVDEAQATRLTAADFTDSRRRLIYKAIIGISTSGKTPALVAVRDYLEAHGELDNAGGAATLAQLAASYSGSDRPGELAQLIHDKGTRRALWLAGRKIAMEAYEESKDLAEVLSNAGTHLNDVEERTVALDRVGEIDRLTDEAIADLMDGTQANGRIATGVPRFDAIAGLWPGELVILAARPSMGKTSFMLNMAHRQAVRGDRSVLIVSRETSRERIVRNLLSLDARVDSAIWRNSGPHGNATIGRLVGAKDRIDPASERLFIDDRASSVEEIAAQARRLKRMHSLHVVYVDHLGLLAPPKADSRTLELAAMTRRLKGLAGELGICVVALHQLNRSVESRENKRPMLYDLRDSGAIEQDADVCAFLYRSDYYAAEGIKSPEGEAELILRKNRHGETGTVFLHYDLTCSLFAEAARVQDAEPPKQSKGGRP